MIDLMEQVKAILKEQLSEEDYDDIEPLKLHIYDETTGNVVIFAKNSSDAIYLQVCLSNQVVEAFEKICGKEITVICKPYPSQRPKPHKRFLHDLHSGQDEDTSYSFYTQFFELQKRVEELEKIVNNNFHN